MKRQKSNTESLVYAYGVIPPADNSHVQEEVSRMRDMWNSLVDTNKEHAHVLDQTIQDDWPEYAAAVQSLRDTAALVRQCVDERNQARAKARSKSGIDPELQEKVNQAVALRNDARKHTWDMAGKWRKNNKEKVSAIEKARREANKKIRQQSGLYWGNYNQILDAFETARITCMKMGRRVRHVDQRREDGCLTVQIIKTRSGLGADPEELMNGVVRPVRIKPVEPFAFSLPRAARTRECKTEMTMRVDASGHTITCPVWLHRPLPELSRIKKAQLTWKRQGESMVGKLCLTVSREKEHRLHESSSAVGIDLGWRLLDDGSLMVATCIDTHDDVERCVLDARWMGGMDQVERLSSYIDDGLLEVGAYITANAKNLPDLLTGPVSGWSARKGARHIDATALHDAVRELDWQVPEEVLHWYKRYRHLLLWRDNLRAKLIGRRRETYRLFSRKMAGKHAVIGMEEMDLSKMARTKKKDDHTDNDLHLDARAQRVRACVHDLRSEMRHQAKKAGAEIVMVNSPYTTMRCRECGNITDQIRREVREWTCQICGAVWDQDENAAGNILAAAIDNAEYNLLDAPKDKKSRSYDPIRVAPKKVRGKRAANP